jgi:hypothetical protein
MGQGNPESADAIFARETNVFVADKLSDQNKNQADKLGVNWVELHSENGFLRFCEILQKPGIPHKNIIGSLDSAVENIFKYIFQVS